MRVLLLLLFTLLAGPAVAQGSAEIPAGCQEDNSDCREDCTIEYGSSTRTYTKLGTCLQQCKQKYDKCRERHSALGGKEKSGFQPPAGSKSAPGEDAAAASASSDKTPSPKSEAAEPAVRRGVYRASESEPEPEPSKAPEPKTPAKPEPTAKSDAKPEPVKPSEPAKPSEPTKPTAKSAPAPKAAQPDR